MMISVHFAFHIFFWIAQDFVSCDQMKTSVDFVTVELGDPLTLNCTYNCSTGFVRGCWSKANISDCQLPVVVSKTNSCTMSLNLLNVSTEDLKKNYTCYTTDREDPRLPQKTERIVILQLQAQGIDQQGIVTPETETKNASLPAQANNSSGGEFTGMKVLATVTVLVATVLAALAVYLCFNRSKQNWNGEPVVSRSSSLQPPHAVPLPMKGTQSTQNERVTLRIPQADNDSDTEVPYADIMITVRGVSTPELTQVGYLTAGDQKEWWGDESRCHLQASRSADRLHVPQPREVSRKMSTNSEYAVITYA